MSGLHQIDIEPGGDPSFPLSLHNWGSFCAKCQNPKSNWQRQERGHAASENWKPPRQAYLQMGLKPDTQRGQLGSGSPLCVSQLSSSLSVVTQVTLPPPQQSQDCLILAASDPSKRTVSLALFFWQNRQVMCHRVSLVMCLPITGAARGMDYADWPGWVPCPLLDVQRRGPLSDDTN